MAEMILVLGSSGQGKSTSLRNMPPDETFLIQCTPKLIPFKGGNRKYQLITKENPDGNLFITDKSDSICKILKKISENDKFKYVVIDDMNLTMSNSFMRQVRIKTSGGEAFERFNILAAEFNDIVDTVLKIENQDLIVVVMLHCSLDDFGNIEIKTVGKLVKNQVYIESKTSICLLSKCNDGEYKFVTNGISPIKSPMGMFESTEIDNDLYYVVAQINKYKHEEN